MQIGINNLNKKWPHCQETSNWTRHSKQQSEVEANGK